MRFLRHLLLTLVVFASGALVCNGQTSADVIVYGSTPGGYCAAIAAAREGATVILLEPTNHVGGMNTGGLGFSDSNQMYRDKLMGLFHEWHLRIQQDYESRGVSLPYDVNVKDQTTWSYEPHVASRVTDAMLSEAGVTVLTGRYLQSVTKTGPRITGVVTSNGTYTGRVFIDGSYEGDLMAAAGVGWTIGREGRSDFNESRAGKVYPKSTMNIDGFASPGVPLPLITTTDAGPVDDGDDNIMTYSFRLSMTNVAANRVPMPEPASYDPARFEVMRRYVQVHGANSVGFDLYNVPGSKRDGNNSIGKQFSLGLVGGAKDWHSADEAGRAAIFEAHKQYTLEFYKFLTTDPVFTQAQRDNYAQWGLCADEFTATGNFPPQLYVRESRRMQGMYVITENDIISNPSKPDPIMVSSFPIDSHDCQRVILPDGKVINEGTIYPVKPAGNSRGYPHHVPYRAILPQPAECDNLLVPVALSCTHVAISSLRIEATWMLIGQSAGIAAAMAADRDIAVQDLPYADLKPQLEAQGQVLTLPLEFQPPEPLDGIVLDDPDAALTGTWGSSTTFTPYVGAGYRFTGAAGTPNDGTATATFRFAAAEAGLYQFNMAYSPDPSRSTNVPVTITSGPHVTNFSVDQTLARPAGSVMRAIGTVQLAAGVETVVRIATAGTTGFVILDAVQFVLDTPGEGGGTSSAEGAIYRDDFSADSGDNLDGTTPDVTTGTTTWTASSDWKADGSIPSLVNNLQDDSAFLPFEPESGKVYTLSATLNQPAGGGASPWAAIGFTATNITTGSFWANSASPWVLYRPNSNLTTFNGPGVSGVNVSDGNFDGPRTLTIVLDTTAAQWTAEWFVDATSVRGPETLPTNPEIQYVGLGREDGAGVDFARFELSVQQSFANWIAGYPGVGGQTGIDQDPDHDGIDNGVENFFGTEPGTFNQGLVAGSLSGNQFTFTHPQGSLADDLSACYRWSTDLVTFHAGGASIGGTSVAFSTDPNPRVADTPTTVTATVTGTPVNRLFVDVEVTPK